MRITIGAKLIGLIAFVLVGSISSLVWISTRLFIESDTALIQQSNADMANNLAAQMRFVFQGVNEKMRLLNTLFAPEMGKSAFLDSAKKDFFSQEQDLVGFFLIRNQPRQIERVLLSPLAEEFQGLSHEKWFSFFEQEAHLNLSESFSQGKVQVSSFSLSPPFSSTENQSQQQRWFIFSQPYIQDPSHPSQFTHLLLGVLNFEKWMKSFSESNAITSFMVDRTGTLLAHSDVDLSHNPEAVRNLEIVRQMVSGNFNNGQTRYLDPQTHQAKLGAFRLVGFGGLGVIAEVEEARAFEAAKKVESRSILVGWITLCLAFLFGYLYAQSLTWPIRLLSAAARQISQGDFKIQLKPRGRDEIAQLSLAFNEMARGLEERDRVKETFHKFHNKEIAEKILSGELKLGGERKEATIFFSDVRGFTNLSESMQPEEVVEMLNEYMTRMVSVIRNHGGVVDKYVGDAIMALWGVPVTHEGDSILAVRACLEMRKELADLNELRLSRNQPVIKIGMGLNRGPLIAGNIGSIEKMEYTVIGDSVNLASRIESMTKEHGTDLLISESIYQEVASHFVVESCIATKVKGKAEAIQIYRVLGFYDDQQQPVLVETPYSSYTAEKSDKVVH